MPRNVRKSAAKFMHDITSALMQGGNLTMSDIKSFAVVDIPDETSVETVLKTLTAQKFVSVSGEGDTAKYNLTPAGSALFNDLEGRK